MSTEALPMPFCPSCNLFFDLFPKGQHVAQNELESRKIVFLAWKKMGEFSVIPVYPIAPVGCVKKFHIMVNDVGRKEWKRERLLMNIVGGYTEDSLYGMQLLK